MTGNEMNIDSSASRTDWNWTTLLTYYNGSSFIESALKSVISAFQELVACASPDNNIELLIVDDCSAKDEALKLAEITSHLSFPGSCHLTVVHLPTNCGVSRARYEGLRRSRHSFVHIMDQDDEVKPGFYTSVISHYAYPEDDVIGKTLWITGCEYIDARDVVTGVNSLSFSEAPARHLNDVGLWLSVGNQVHGSPGMVVLSPSLKEEAEQYFGLLDRGIDGSDDSWMFIYLLKRGAHFTVADELGFRYRRHESNQSIEHDFVRSGQRGLVIMYEEGLISERERSVVEARYRLLSRLQRHPGSRLMRLLVYLSSPGTGWHLLWARLTS